MKKLLIATLALITALSISLAACDKNKNNDEPAEDPDDDLVARPSDTTPVGGTTTTGNGDNNNNNNNNGSSVQWVEQSQTIYVLLDCNIRNTPSTSSSENIINTARFGQSFQATASNSNWYKIVYDAGTDGVAYISKDLVSLSSQRVTVIAKAEADQIAVHLKSSGNSEAPTSANLREFPTKYAISFGTITELITADSANTLKLLGVTEDGSWAKVSFTGTIGSTTFTDKICYIDAGVLAELNVNTGNSQLPG